MRLSPDPGSTQAPRVDLGQGAACQGWGFSSNLSSGEEHTLLVSGARPGTGGVAGGARTGAGREFAAVFQTGWSGDR